jgi:Fic family protein
MASFILDKSLLEALFVAANSPDETVRLLDLKPSEIEDIRRQEDFSPSELLLLEKLEVAARQNEAQRLVKREEVSPPREHPCFARLFELDCRMQALRAKVESYPDRLRIDYETKLDVSWLFHDNALEGIVLSYSELKSAIDHRIISDPSLAQMYQEVKNHKAAMDFIREMARARRPPRVDLDLIRKVYSLVTPDAVAKGLPYRKNTPLHRLYYHEIAAPERIVHMMRKLAEWLESSEFENLHSVTKAYKLQFRLLHAYPWTQNSGKVARLLTNYILLRDGYVPAVVHSIDRQRYYEALRREDAGLLSLLLESLENTIDTMSRFYDEGIGQQNSGSNVA